MSELTAQRVKAFVDEVASDWDTTRGRSVGIPTGQQPSTQPACTRIAVGAGSL